ncbi:MAG: ATP-binding protein [Muribaculum sp.]|nr:ATP-binding protein [Muribaculum sp.]
MDTLLPEIKYPVGIQTFSKIREQGMLYVDKTGIIYKLANNYSYVFLSRPRRFGKSLLVSTLQSYFEGKKELFKGLAIEQLESRWESYPVLRFDLSAANFDNQDVLIKKISSYLEQLESEFGLPIGDDRYNIGDRFRTLIRSVFQNTGKRVVVLIDEYDKPMLDSIHDSGLHEKLKATLRGFYSTLKECDEYIRFVFITGVSKFSKVSIFSGLNNLWDISLNPEYNEICGISEKEFHDNFGQSVKLFAERNSISEEETWNRFKSFYDGYHFSWPATDIYNPFSTLNAFANYKLKGYWFTSGSSGHLVNLIKRQPYVIEKLEGVMRTEESLSDISDVNHDLIPLLYQAGYLTIKDYDEMLESYTLGFPNKEVSQGFWSSLSRYFFMRVDKYGSYSQQDFMLDLMHGRADEFMTRMQSLFASLSSEQEPDKEVHFQIMLTVFVKMLGLRAVTELHSSQGRSDLIIETPQYIYIIELKVDSTPEKALAQIHEKGYARPFASDPRQKILIGANFSKAARTLTGWIIEDLDTIMS